MSELEIQPVCEQCGLCCSSYTFWMTNRDYEDDPKEIKRLIQYHGCIPVRNQKGELGMSVPIKCRFLIFKDEKWACAIEDKKPVVCKEYFCERVIKKALNGIHV